MPAPKPLAFKKVETFHVDHYQHKNPDPAANYESSWNVKQQNGALAKGPGVRLLNVIFTLFGFTVRQKQ